MLPFYETPHSEMRAFNSIDLHFPLHLHSSVELLYVTEGSAKVTIKDQTRILSTGDFAVIFPNVIHCYEMLPNIPWRSILIICEPQMTGEYLNTLKKYHPVDPCLAGSDLHPDIPFAMKRLVEQDDKDGKQGISRAYLQLILAHILPAMLLEENNSMDAYDLTYHIIDYIGKNFRQPLTLAILAEELCISRFYLSRIFSAKFGMSFNEYLNRIRLDFASAMIRNTDNSFTVISDESGFDSQRTFNRVFKNIYSMTPTEYRFHSLNGAKRV